LAAAVYGNIVAPMPGSHKHRQIFVRERTDVRKADILEVGALDSPTFPKLTRSYLDWFTLEELRREHPRRQVDRMVDPTHVVKDKRFADAIDERFDLIIANHVLEHIADPLTWLQQLRALIRPDGHLFLTVPDRRYTFDYLRPTSTVGHLLRAQAEDLQQPSYWQVFEAKYYYRPLKARDVWAGDLSKLERRPRTIDEALAIAEQATHEYIDVHCHVFTADSFRQLMTDLQPIAGWAVDDLEEPIEGDNEMHAWLKPI
jgi:SAM-dependent methyltransferase